LSHTSSPFYFGYFGNGVSWTVCSGWAQTTILWISASQVAGITVPSLTFFFFLVCQDLNSGPTSWATPPALFLWWVFFEK
jgi:hypothetical protein